MADFRGLRHNFLPKNTLKSHLMLIFAPVKQYEGVFASYTLQINGGDIIHMNEFSNSSPFAIPHKLFY